MNPKDSGHKGGIATRDNHPTLCPLCGHLVKSQFYSEAGMKGGQATLKKYGKEHYIKAGRLGGRGNRRSNNQEGLESLPALRSSN